MSELERKEERRGRKMLLLMTKLIIEKEERQMREHGRGDKQDEVKNEKQ